MYIFGNGQIDLCLAHTNNINALIARQETKMGRADLTVLTIHADTIAAVNNAKKRLFKLVCSAESPNALFRLSSSPRRALNS